MVNSSLPQKLRAACAFDHDAATEYKRQCLPLSGKAHWWHGIPRGAEWENSRLRPLLDSMIECVEALKASYCFDDTPPMPGVKHSDLCRKCQALTKLQSLLERGG